MAELKELNESLANLAKRFSYYGFNDPAEAQQRNMSPEWKKFPATKEGEEEARRVGYTGKSVYDFLLPENGKGNPKRYGDMLLDFDAPRMISGKELNKEEKIYVTLLAVRFFIQFLTLVCKVNPNAIRIYASGGKGFHLLISSYAFGAEDGDYKLNEIYRKTLSSILDSAYTRELFLRGRNLYLWDNVSIPKELYIDWNVFKGGKSQLNRLPHIQRLDGNFKVPVTMEEVLHEEAIYFTELVKNDRHLPIENEPLDQTLNEYLSSFYSDAKKKVYFYIRQFDKTKCIYNLETKCTFIQHCKNDAENLSENEWFFLARILAPLRKEGQELFLEYSSLDSKRYKREEANSKFLHADGYRPTRCKEIKELFDCGKTCNVDSPIDLFYEEEQNSDLANFELVNDRLVYHSYDGNDIDVSSYIKAVALARDENNKNWSTVFEIKDFGGSLHRVRIPREVFAKTGHEALSMLLNEGLSKANNEKAKKLLNLYIEGSQPAQKALILSNNGWVRQVPNFGVTKFMPFDEGQQRDRTDYLIFENAQAKEVYSSSGTLEEWQKTIGVWSLHNPLLQISILLAFSGPCLRLVDHQGFGIHLYGSSSSGKTTAMKVAASVTGGPINTWRSTSNGLETLAAQHNDSSLLLDEINQADEETVDSSSYFLANGSGKNRSSKQGELRNTKVWLVTFLSNGEEASQDVIRRSRKKTIMAGQIVRMVDLRANAEYGVFSVIPEGMKNGAEFSNKLKEAAKQHRGVAFRRFIRVLQNYTELFKNEYFEQASNFDDLYKDIELNRQQQRVKDHFAFLAGVGEFLIKHRILPWPKGEAIKVSKFCFDNWRSTFNSQSDLQIEQSVEELIKLTTNNFYIKKDERSVVTEFNVGGNRCYFLPKGYVIRKICKPYQYDELIDALMKRGMLVLTKTGRPLEQPTFYDASGAKKRPRGIVINYTKVIDPDLDSDAVSVDDSLEETASGNNYGYEDYSD